MKRYLLIACFICIYPLGSAAVAGVFISPVYAQETFKKGQLTVITATGGHFPFHIEIAETSAQRTQGLQGRGKLALGVGMLFDFKKPQLTAMWMKNTFVSLDMIFIAADGKIIKIARKTTPESLSIIESGGLVLGVLEIRAGTADRLGIKKGDRVEHRIFE